MCLRVAVAHGGHLTPANNDAPVKADKAETNQEASSLCANGGQLMHLSAERIVFSF